MTVKPQHFLAPQMASRSVPSASSLGVALHAPLPLPRQPFSKPLPRLGVAFSPRGCPGALRGGDGHRSCAWLPLRFHNLPRRLWLVLLHPCMPGRMRHLHPLHTDHRRISAIAPASVRLLFPGLVLPRATGRRPACRLPPPLASCLGLGGYPFSLTEALVEGASRVFGSLLGHNDYGCVPCSGHLFYLCQASACSGVPNWTQPLSPRGRERGARGGCKDNVMGRETRHPLTPTTQRRLTVQKIFFSKVTRLCFVAGGLLAPGSSGHGLQVATHTWGRAAR